MIKQNTTFHIPSSYSSRVHIELQKYNLILLDNKIHCPTALQFALQTDIFVLSHKTNTGKVVHVQAMKEYRRMVLRLHSLLTSALDGGECSGCSAGHFIPRKSVPGIHQVGGWMGPRTSLHTLDRKKNLFPPTDCLACGLVYHLLYPGSHTQA